VINSAVCILIRRANECRSMTEEFLFRYDQAGCAYLRIHTYVVEDQQFTDTDNWPCIKKMIKRIFEIWEIRIREV